MPRSPLVLLLVAACSTPPVTKQPEDSPLPPEPTPEPVAELGGEVMFRGMCDASGAVALTDDTFIAADDEDNVLRVYDAAAGGEPLHSADMSEGAGVPLKGKKKPKHPEMDLEAATRIGDRAYWISSHGRSKKGKLKQERLRFFATTLSDADTIEVIGATERLLDDLIADPRYAGFDLQSASELAPKEPGGLNIEGLTATPDHDVLIGFRNPIPGGRALLVPLGNPEALVADANATPELGDPILLDLGGQGVRSMSWWRGRYLIVAGDISDGAPSNLYSWDGVGEPARIDVDVSGYNPEGFFSPEARDEIMLLSDDGSVLVDGTACKKLKDPTARRFRGVWLRVR